MKYLTVNQVAKKLQCSIPTIYRYIADRYIPHVKLNHRVLFIEAEIDRWVLSQRVPTIESYLPDNSKNRK